jgi:hypothetical protein
MGVPSITSNLAGFGCYMEELIENAQDYGIYIVDRRQKGVDDSVNQLTEYMFEFSRKSMRQRINQRNRTERLSDLLDWKRMGLEYVKARQLALRRGTYNLCHWKHKVYTNQFQPTPKLSTAKTSLTFLVALKSRSPALSPRQAHLTRRFRLSARRSRGSQHGRLHRMEAPVSQNIQCVRNGTITDESMQRGRRL